MTAASGERHALIVATARYDDPKLDRLRSPAADAAALAAVLADPEKGAFAVQTVVDEPQGTVARRIASFFRDRRPDDLLLVHFSCHGVKDDRGELFLAATDTEVDLLSATGISALWLNDQITRTRSRRTVVLLDCCFSGAFPLGLRPRSTPAVDAPDQLQGRGRAIITASSAMEYAFEGDQLTGEGQPSVFTAAVVEGLDTGHADLDGDGLISVDDLYHYVYDQVSERTPSQRPSKKSDLEGPLYLATGAQPPAVGAHGGGGGEPPARPGPVAAAPPPSTPARRRPSRRLTVLLAAGAVTAAVVVGAVLLTGGGDGSQSNEVDPTTWVPDWCAWVDVPDPVKNLDAQRAVRCDVPGTLVTADVHGAEATFARYASPAEARVALKEERNALARSGGSATCGAGAERELTSIAYAGRAYCLPRPSGKTWVGFNKDRSDVTGSVTFDPPTDELSAVDTFHRMAATR